MRLKDIRGEYEASVKDAEDNPRTIKMVEGSVIKIWRRKSETEDVMLVVTTIHDPDGILTDTITRTVEVEPGVEVAEVPTEGEWPEIPTPVTSTTSTTTTTLPDATPKGKL
jgi:hypothetical protein